MLTGICGLCDSAVLSSTKLSYEREGACLEPETRCHLLMQGTTGIGAP